VITLRPARPEDREFLFSVYASTRADEMAMVPWDDVQKHAFLASQFAAQTAHYTSEYPNATHDLILFDGQPAGRVYVERRTDHIAILDVTVLTSFRRNGIGTEIVSRLLREGEEAGCPVGVYVETFNPSQELFRRLGFEAADNDGVNVRMEWRPHA